MKKNPIGITMIGDPFLLKASDGKYYLYATTFKKDTPNYCGFHVWVSEDLNSFSKPLECYYQSNRSFGYMDYWAPEVVEYNGKFIMYYSARRREDDSLRIGVAISDSPIGPFIDVYEKMPMFDFGYAAIDGHVFIDDDGKKYFYYSRDCSENFVNGNLESHIYVAKLTDDLLGLKEEGILLSAPTESYEKCKYKHSDHNVYWNEGPFVVKYNGLYHLMYSANFFASNDYCLCAAWSKYPNKGFQKYDQPLLKKINNRISGPGHNSVVKLGENDYLCVYHVLTDSENPSADRQVFISKMKFLNDRIVIEQPEL